MTSRRTAILLSKTLKAGKRYDKSRRMKAIRGYVRKRDRYRCTSCGIKQSPYTRIIVHHVVPVSQGGDHHPDNLKCKCDPCHAKIHPWLEKNGRVPRR